MNKNTHGSIATRWVRKAALVVAALAGLVLMAAPPAARAAENKLSKESLACLKCHDDPKLDKTTEDGKKLSLNVSMQAFLASMHKDNDCEDCHSGLDEKTHGKVPSPLASHRAMTASMQESCRDCHKKKYKQYDDSIHALLIKDGSKKAPLCADCHNAHTQPSVKALAPIDKTPCASCHDKIFEAYKADVHGLERVAKGKTAPICSDCHQAHDVKAAAFDDAPRRACLNCHKNALAEHQDWLPNTGRHFDAVACTTCHSPKAQRRVNLRLFDDTTNLPLREKTGVPQFVPRTQAGDAANLGLDERALWSLLTQFSRDGGAAGPTKAVVHGRLELRSGVDAHRLAPKEEALKDCDACHAQGAEPFQSVVLSIAGPDGRALRHGVQKDVLSSLTAMESVRGFYAIGSTRIKLLDTLLVLVVAGSIGGPLVHMGVRRAMRGSRERREQAEAAARAAAAAGKPEGTP